MAQSSCFVLLAFILASSLLIVHAQGPWKPAHATFYGDEKGHQTEAGACAYKDVFKMGYDLETTALSSALFNNGSTCGACFEIYCYNVTWCHANTTITVTATNLCPPNWSKPSTAGGWCNPPLEHFDLSEPMFLKIAQYKAGIVPVMYRRVLCVRTGGIKFEMGGNNWFTTIVVYNVGGDGDVTSVAVRTTGSSGYTQLKRNWGQLWAWPDNSAHHGQGMSIQVTTTDGKMVESDNVVPANWQIGQTYEGKQF